MLIETSAKTSSYVILVQRGTEIMYLSKDSFSSKHLNCTKKIKIAKRFNDLKQAQSFWKNWSTYDEELKFLEIRGILISFELRAELEDEEE